MSIPHKVTIACDSLDPNPVVMEFETEWEALDWLGEEIQRRVSFEVEHSPYAIGEQELNEIEETVSYLAHIERLA